MAMTEHCYSTVFILFSPKVWDSLKPEDQKIINDVMAKANLDERKLSREMDKQAIKNLESKGMKVTYPDKKPFIEKSAAVRDKYSAEYKDVATKIAALAN